MNEEANLNVEYISVDHVMPYQYNARTHVGTAVVFATAFVDFRLYLPHFLIRNHKEVAGAAGGVKHPYPRHALAQIQQFLWAVIGR